MNSKHKSNKHQGTKRGSPRRNGHTEARGNGQVRLSGTEILTPVQNGAGNIAIFAGATTIPISPDQMGQRVAEMADLYNQYRFVRLSFTYVPAYYQGGYVPTAQSTNLFAFGYEDDGVLTITPTFNNVAQLRHNITTPALGYQMRSQNTLRCTSLSKKWYYTKNDTATDADIRQTIQGLLYGTAQSNITNVTIYGVIHVAYVVDFKEQCPTQGVTLERVYREFRLGKSSLVRNLLSNLQLMATTLAKDPKPPLTAEHLKILTNEQYRIVLGRPRPTCLLLEQQEPCDYLKELSFLEASALSEIVEIEDEVAQQCRCCSCR
jgi:hypothetical protein